MLSRLNRSIIGVRQVRPQNRTDEPPDWRGFDEQTITDGYRHYQNNWYAQTWGCFRADRAFTGLVNTWIWRLFGFDRRAWMILQVTLHVVNAGIVLGLLRGVGIGFSTACIVSLVFLLHPVQVSAYMQIASRSGMQSATMAYSAMWCLALGFWPVALLAQWLAVKSKEDAWGYLVFWPLILYLT